MTESTPHFQKHYPRSAFATDLEWIRHLKDVYPVLGMKALSIITDSDGHHKVKSPWMPCTWTSSLSDPAICDNKFCNPPNLKCQCGFHIGTDVKEVHPFLNGNGTLCIAIGLGKVCVHDYGYRTEYAQILATLSFGVFLWDHSLTKGSPLSKNEMLYRIGHIYYSRILNLNNSRALLIPLPDFREVPLEVIDKYSRLLSKIWDIPNVPISVPVVEEIRKGQKSFIGTKSQ